jgi:hypothetical protein
MKKKLYPRKYIPKPQKKFLKITMKIDIIGTCPNFQLSPERDFGPLEINTKNLYKNGFKNIM